MSRPQPPHLRALPPTGSASRAGAISAANIHDADSNGSAVNAAPPGTPGATGAIATDALSALARLESEVASLRRRDTEREADLARLEDELRAAGAMQRHLLGGSTPSVRGARIHVIHRSKAQLCGDSYEVRRLDDHRVAFLVSDATGHGLPAALLSASTRTLLRMDSRPGDNGSASAPDEALRRANLELLARELPDCQFLAAIVAVFDESTRVMTWARGGAPYPALVGQGNPVRVLESHGPLLGVTKAARFEARCIELQPGERVVLHTDGVETLVAELGLDAIFGARGDSDAAPGELRDQLESLLNLRADLIDDDVTILALEITGD